VAYNNVYVYTIIIPPNFKKSNTATDKNVDFSQAFHKWSGFLEHHGVRDLSGRNKIATYGTRKSKTPRHIA
jgi:hypothetical protein